MITIYPNRFGFGLKFPEYYWIWKASLKSQKVQELKFTIKTNIFFFFFIKCHVPLGLIWSWLSTYSFSYLWIGWAFLWFWIQRCLSPRPTATQGSRVQSTLLFNLWLGGKRKAALTKGIWKWKQQTR